MFTDGRGGVRWDERGNLAGLADGFFEDMDRALEIAGAAGLRLCLVLFDFSWMRQATHVDESGQLIFKTRPDIFSIHWTS